MRSGGTGSLRPVWIAGTGDPAVVLSAYRDGPEEWRRVALGLSRSLRILMVGPTPHGAAGDPERDLPRPDPDEELGELLRRLDHWPAHLIGVGAEAGRALEVAHLHPELVRGMVLHEPTGSLGARSRSGPAPGMARPEDPDDRPGLAESPAEPAAWMGGAMASGDLEHPVLVSAGSESPWPRREAAHRLAGRLPNARWLLLPGVAGRPHLESPDLFMAVVTEFLTVRSVSPS